MRTIDGELIFEKQTLTPDIKEFIDKYDIPEYKVYMVEQSYFQIFSKEKNQLLTYNLRLDLYHIFTDDNINEIQKSDYIFINKFDMNKILCCYDEKRYSRLKKLASL